MPVNGTHGRSRRATVFVLHSGNPRINAKGRNHANKHTWIHAIVHTQHACAPKLMLQTFASTPPIYWSCASFTAPENLRACNHV